jgi:hypothetical protein
VAYLAKGWADDTNAPTLSFELDFSKAFNQVNFEYLGKQFKQVGLGGKFLQLVKGLVIGATTKIIVNGLIQTK